MLGSISEQLSISEQEKNEGAYGLLYASQNVLEVTQSLVATPGMCEAQNVCMLSLYCPAPGCLPAHRSPVKDATACSRTQT
jgi:hypothetical protein